MRTEADVDSWIEYGHESIYCASASPIAIEEPREAPMVCGDSLSRTACWRRVNP